MKSIAGPFVTVSVPRIRDCSSSFKMPSMVTDSESAHMICVLRLALPRCGIILSTREPADLEKPPSARSHSDERRFMYIAWRV